MSKLARALAPFRQANDSVSTRRGQYWDHPHRHIARVEAVKQHIQMHRSRTPEAVPTNEEEKKRGIVLLGQRGCGMSSLIKRFLKDQFPSNSTTDLNVFRPSFSFQHETFKYEIRDKRSTAMRTELSLALYRPPTCAMLCFDGSLGGRKESDSEFFLIVTQENALEQIYSEILRDLANVLRAEVLRALPKLLVGMKVDAPGRVVSFDDAVTFATEHGLFGYVETSAATSTAVDLAFKMAAGSLMPESPVCRW